MRTATPKSKQVKKPSRRVETASNQPSLPFPGQRKGTFAKRSDLAKSAAIVRGVLLRRVDDVAGRVIEELMREFGVKEEVLVEILFAFQVAMFPEEFEKDERVEAIVKAASEAKAGIMPSDGRLKGVGEERLRAFVGMLRGQTSV